MHWLNEWENEKPLSGGGQGITTVLTNKRDSTRLAVLKRIVERWRNDPQAQSRLLQEAQTLEKLHKLGAKVPELYDSIANHKSGEPFLLMEYIHGMRFDQWLAANAPASIAVSIAITQHIAETIQFCHENNIGHRDLKPANIILKYSDFNLPYILDFGITFDSQQSVILTQAGEIFHNEFITLPECQDLGGGHRDLRSDITALAGLFFTCLTGHAPRVLLDAQGHPPHQRYEKILRKAGNTAEQGEHLMWLFDRAFSYNIAERFQSLDIFLKQLQQLSIVTESQNLSLHEEMSRFNQTVLLNDRNVQIADLRQKFFRIKEHISSIFQKQISNSNPQDIFVQSMGLSVTQFSPSDHPKSAAPEILDTDNIATFSIRRNNFNQVAVSMFSGFAVGMDVEIYSTYYTTPATNLVQPQLPLVWKKIATFRDGTDWNASPSINVVLKDIETNLARQLRNFSRTVSAPK